MTNFYQGKHRHNLGDDSDLDALQKEHEAQFAPKPQDDVPAEVAEVAPAADTLPEPKNVEEETFKKRYSDLRRHMAAKEKDWQKKFQELEEKFNSTVS